MANKKDYYKLLNVSKDASASDIKKAFRKLAMKYHPDVNKEANAEDKFKEINEAYEILGDEQKRKIYDQYGHAGLRGNQGGFGGFSSGGFGNLEDILNDMFGGSPFGGSNPFGGSGFGGFRSSRSSGLRRGSDIQVVLGISLKEAYKGTTKNVEMTLDENCDTCKGKGFESDADLATCDSCHGQGKTVKVMRTPFGNMQQQSTCGRCGGKGKVVKHKCKSCSGKGFKSKNKELEITIPKGISSGQVIPVRGKGGVGRSGGPQGDLLFIIEVQEDKYFERHDDDLYLEVDISVLDLVKGKTIDVFTPSEKVTVEIPEGSKPTTKLRIKGKGFDVFGTKILGDMYITFNAKSPTKLTKKDRNLLDELINNLKDKTYNEFHSDLEKHISKK